MSEEKRSIVELIESAKKGDNEAMAEILEMYLPLINKHCYVNGMFEEDLRQEIFLRIMSNISLFEF